MDPWMPCCVDGMGRMEPCKCHMSRRGREGLVLVSMVVLLETAYWIDPESGLQPCSAQ